MSNAQSDAGASPRTLAEIEQELAAVAAATPAPTKAELIAAVTAAWDKALPLWLGAAIYNSPVAQSTPAFGHLTTVALPKLLDAITKEL